MKRSVFIPDNYADNGSRIISVENHHDVEPIAIPAWQRRRVMACVISCR